MKIAFAGTPEFAIPFLEALFNATEHEIVAIYTQPDRPAGRGLRLTPTPIKTYAIEKIATSVNANIPLIQPNKFSDEGILQQLQQINPDVFIDVACGLFIPKRVLNLPLYGCVNVHPSLLPRWRGASPIQRAILAGDSETGITIMQMDAGLDTGPIFQQATIKIEENDTTLTLSEKLIQHGVPLLLNTIDKLANNAIQAQPQDNSQQIYAEKITKEEAKIDWHKKAIEIHRMIRAYNPFPIAYTNIEQNICKIYEAQVLPNINTQENNIQENIACGTILACSQQGIDIQTGNGILRILQLQLPNKKILKAKDFLNSTSNAELFKIGRVVGLV